MGGFTNTDTTGTGTLNGNNAVQDISSGTGFDESSLKGEYYGLG